jgi:hypothetical protein
MPRKTGENPSLFRAVLYGLLFFLSIVLSLKSIGTNKVVFLDTDARDARIKNETAVSSVHPQMMIQDDSPEQ